jgi:hypothetical protein
MYPQHNNNLKNLKIKRNTKYFKTQTKKMFQKPAQWLTPVITAI